MSKVIYHVGAKEFSFESKLQLKDIPLLAVEENLNEEVKLDLKRRDATKCNVHDIFLSDDNGIIACIDSFSIIGGLKIVVSQNK